jgi:hypothetical protein
MKFPAFIKIKLANPKAKLIVYASFNVQDPSKDHNDWFKVDPRVVRINSSLYSSYLYLTFESDTSIDAELAVYSEEVWAKIKRGVKIIRKKSEDEIDIKDMTRE